MSTIGLTIKADSRGARRELKLLDRELDNVNKSTDRVEKKFASFGKKSAIAIGATLGTAFGLATKSAVAFEKSMAEISTLLSGDISKKTDELSKGIQDLSAAYGGTLQENASAAYAIISAGASDSAEAIKLLDAANKLAIGGVTDVATAADGLTSALNAYGATADEAGSFSDSLFVAMKAGKTTIGELSSVMGRLAPTAATLGVGFDEMTAALSTLTTTGLSTEMATTQLSAALTAILKPSKEANDLALDLGLSFNSQALEAQGLAGFLKSVTEATNGNKEEMAALFGSVEAVKAVLSLTGEQAGTFSDTLANMSNKAGATDEAFSKMSKTVSVQWDMLKSKATVLGTQIATALLPALLKVVNFLSNDMANAFKSARLLTTDAIEAFASMAKSVVKFAKAMAKGVTDAFDRLLKPFRMIGEATEEVTGFFKEMWDKVSRNSYVPDMVDDIEEEFNRLDNVMVGTAEEATGETTEVFRQFSDESLKIFENFTRNVQEAFGGLIYDGFQSIFRDGENAWKTFLDTLMDMFLRFIADLVAAWVSKNIFGNLFGGAGGLLGGIGSALSGGSLGGLGTAIASSSVGKFFLGSAATTSTGAGGGAAGVLAAGGGGSAAAGGATSFAYTGDLFAAGNPVPIGGAQAAGGGMGLSGLAVNVAGLGVIAKAIFDTFSGQEIQTGIEKSWREAMRLAEEFERIGETGEYSSEIVNSGLQAMEEGVHSNALFVEILNSRMDEFGNKVTDVNIVSDSVKGLTNELEAAGLTFDYVENQAGETLTRIYGDTEPLIELYGQFAKGIDQVGYSAEAAASKLAKMATYDYAYGNPYKATRTDSTGTYGYDDFDLPGYASGGSFLVGGRGGTDNNLVAFRASRGERVTIDTPAQQKDTPIVINIQGDGKGLDQFIRVVSDDHRVKINQSGVRPDERVY